MNSHEQSFLELQVTKCTISFFFLFLLTLPLLNAEDIA